MSSLAGLVLKVLGSQFGAEAATILYEGVCQQIGVNPAELTHDQVAEFSLRMQQAVGRHLGEQRARFLGELLRHFARSEAPGDGSPQSAAATPPSAQTQDAVQKQLDQKFAENFTFARFSVDRENSEAYDACAALSKGQVVANPLFLYGAVGSGKTHLLNAIGHRLKNEGTSQVSVMLVPYSTVKEEFLDALSNNTIDALIQRYSQVNFLLIDDIQFLTGHPRLQTELFKVLESVIARDGRVVVTSDRPPEELEGLQQRMADRFARLQSINLRYPTPHARIAILETIARGQGWAIPRPVLVAIARRYTANIRQLKGALTKVVTHASVMKEVPSEDLVKRVLGTPDKATER